MKKPVPCLSMKEAYMRLLFFCLIACTAISAFTQNALARDVSTTSQNASERGTQSGKTCPNAEKLEQICSSVNAMEPDDGPSPTYRYFYQRQVMEAACVDSENDSVEVRNEKIGRMWKAFENKELVCNSLQFDVPNGNIIKYAAMMNFDTFIRDVIRWNVNLNKVDAFDGRTLLDYLSFHIERTKGGEIEKKLKYYYGILRKAGAKHKSEL